MIPEKYAKAAYLSASSARILTPMTGSGMLLRPVRVPLWYRTIMMWPFPAER